VSPLWARLDSQATPPLGKQPRAGKRVSLWEQAVAIEGIAHPVRRVLRLIERNIDKHDQVLAERQLTLEGWTTSLPAKFSAQDVALLYAHNGTHEQFHSDFKTDLDLTRLPSGKFANTNYQVCQLAALAMNMLRLMGASAACSGPVRHSVKRRRIKTVCRS